MSIGVSILPSKHPLFYTKPAPTLNLQTVQTTPLSRQFPPMYWVYMKQSPKTPNFPVTPIKFFILNPIPSFN